MPRLIRRLGALGLAATLAGCGAAAAPSAPASSAVPAGGAIQTLYKQAQTEGQITWYTSQNDAVIGSVVQAFEQAYPGVKVNRSQKTVDQEVAQLEVEKAANKISLDVAQSPDNTLNQIVAEGLAAKVDWAGLGVAKARNVQDLFVDYADSPNVWTYNTQKVSAGDAPRSWDDLLDPKWQGKMAVEGRGSVLQAFLAAPKLGGQAKGLEFAAKLTAQQPLFQPTASSVEPMVISGQASVGTDTMQNVLAVQKKGAPIEAASVSPMYVPGIYAFAVTGAPHPAAAQLLIAWLASPAGQAPLDAAGISSLASCDTTGANALTQAYCSHHIEWSSFGELSQFQQLADFQKQVQRIYGTYNGA